MKNYQIWLIFHKEIQLGTKHGTFNFQANSNLMKQDKEEKTIYKHITYHE